MILLFVRVVECAVLQSTDLNNENSGWDVWLVFYFGRVNQI